MTTTPAATSPSELLETVRSCADAVIEWIDLRRRLLRVPGVQVCLRVGDEVVASEAFGSADLERGTELTTRHLFRVASHSKTFTATAVMQLREDGVVGLDDRIDTWIEELRDHPVGALRVRELLGHQAGIVRDGAYADYWQHLGDFLDEGSLVAAVRDHGRVIETNTHFKYTNIGYSLLGLVVARASGEPFESFVRRRILDPLGLDRVHVDIDGVDLEECAWGHSGRFGRDEDVFVVKNPSTAAMAPATGFVACAEDLSAYAVSHALGDDRLLTDASKRLMQRDESIVMVDGRERGRYGFGLIIDDIVGHRVVGHSGGFPGFITRTMVEPTTRLAVSVLTNQAGGPASELATGALNLIFRAAGPAPAERDESAERALPDGSPRSMTVARAREGGIDPASFTGRFCAAWGHLDIRLTGSRLLAYSPQSPDPADEAEELRIVDADTLVPVLADGYDSPGELWHVTRSADGAPESVRCGGMTHWREDAFFARHRTDAARG